jgi:hypothetical protein
MVPADRQRRDGWNRQEDPGDPAQLKSGEHGDNDRQRVQVDAMSHKARIDHVVLNHADDQEESR